MQFVVHVMFPKVVMENRDRVHPMFLLMTPLLVKLIVISKANVQVEPVPVVIINVSSVALKRVQPKNALDTVTNVYFTVKGHKLEHV